MRRILLIALACVGWIAVPAAPRAESPAPVVATDARLAGDMQRTRFIVDLSHSVEPSAFLLAEPSRVVIELPQIGFSIAPDLGRAGRGLVSAFRFGVVARGKSRIVLDLARPAVIDQVFVLQPVDDQPARLVLDLIGTDDAAFRAVVAAQPPRAPQQIPEPAREKSAAAGLPLIVIDPGHGGIDSGAVTANGDLEKAIVLDFAQTLAEKLVQSGRYDALLTRSDDTFVSLADRVRIARESKAALFLSIHADTLTDPFGVRGATIYTLSEKASDADAEKYAEKENRSDAIAGVDLAAEPDEVADILIDLTRRETKTFSTRFARQLVDEFRAAATLNKNPLRSAGFRVLRAADVPSVLLELGYLSNAQDAKLLISPEWRDRTTDAVLRSVDGFFNARAGIAVTPPVEPEAMQSAN
jgi:N-acetylmuramoyl-L-alanine amidase